MVAKKLVRLELVCSRLLRSLFCCFLGIDEFQFLEIQNEMIRAEIAELKVGR